MCERCLVLQKELNRTRNVIAREMRGFEYDKPDVAVAYGFVVQRIDRILHDAGMPIERRFAGAGITWAYGNVPMPIW